MRPSPGSQKSAIATSLALEHEQFDALPGGVFNKGIVRGYARVVGLDEEEWLERYLSASKSSGAVAEDEDDWMQFAENASKGRESSVARRPEMRLRWTGICALLLLLAGLSWFAWSYIHNKIAAEPHHPAADSAPASAARRQRVRASDRQTSSNREADFAPATRALIGS